MRGRALAVLALCLAAALATAADYARRWQPLAADGIHDPKSPAIGTLQEPREALEPLAPDWAGNQVRWMEAIVRGQIRPRALAQEERQGAVALRETDIFLNLKGGTPIVRFPHKQHTLWLDCSNCHDDLFKKEIGATKIEMRRILQGEQCGLCHGAVSFPLTECSRCHNTPRQGFVRPQDSAGGAALAPAAPGKAAP